MVAALVAGETPDPAFGRRGKQRSLHNNYLTLPVVFVMIGGHYPAVFATDYAWIILALVLVTLLLKLLLRERGKAGQRGGRADG